MSESQPSKSVRDYLLYTLSLPERALRTTTGVAGGAIRESAALLVPQAFQDSKTYSILVGETLKFLTEDVGGVAAEQQSSVDEPAIDDFVARKTVGNFVEMAGLATLHVSPMMLLAVVSDIAYGSQTYLNELTSELKREGVIDADTTIDRTSDLLAAVSKASGVAAAAFNTPPISVDGLREMIEQTKSAVGEIDPTQVLPQAEVERMWNEMQAIAAHEEVSLFEVSSAMALHSLDRVASIGRGALSSTRAVGRLFDRHVVDHYRTALSDIETKGYYATLAETSQPYVDAVWRNFSTDKTTITEDLLSGKLVGQARRTVGRWLGM
ncbi:MAG: hypothetical protein MK171_11655 [Pirellulales bacterium]|nr:hypothetical protein [Pirellulales bacterium]